MGTIYDRTRWLIGEEGLNQLKTSNVIIFGIGGVGGYCVEALARAGVGSITLVDFDVIDPTNLNRQIIALNSTLGMHKVAAMADRIQDINEDILVTPLQTRVTPENIHEFQLEKYDYVMDAIDDVAGKISIITRAKELGIPVISSMGTGNKMNGKFFQVADISKTHTCPLAKRIRKELRMVGINHLKVVYSSEEPARAEERTSEKKSPASISFIPPMAGILMAGEVVRDLISNIALDSLE
jgi:tRNA A37 threonylcarbamoyladenosine dehydratase